MIKSSKVSWFLVSGSSCVEDALGDTIPPTLPVLVLSDPCLFEILVDDSPPLQFFNVGVHRSGLLLKPSVSQ